jgi:hypothetical protein
MLKEVNIFKAGLQTAESGMSREFTLSELDEIVDSYDPLIHEAPIRIGHEDNDKVPAWGWVKGLIRKGEDLYAKVDFSPLAKSFVKNGLYKKVSASFYSPISKINPHPGKWSLRHVALLGAQPPAVKGLKGFAYEEPQSECWSFSSSLEPEKIYDAELGPTMKQSLSPLQMLKEKIDMAREMMMEDENVREPVEMEETSEIKEVEEVAVDMEETEEEVVAEMKEKPKKAKKEEEVPEMEMPEELEDVEEVELKEKPKAKAKKEMEMPEAVEEIIEEVDEIDEELELKEKPKAKAKKEMEMPEAVEEIIEEVDEIDEELELKEKPKAKDKSPKVSKKDLSAEVDKEVSKLLKELDIDVEDMGEELVEEVDMKDYKKEKSKKVTSFSEMGNPDLDKVLARIKELEEANSRLKADVEFAERKAFRTSLQRFTDTLYESGKLTDSVIKQDELIDYMEGLEYGTYQFSEGESIITPLVTLLNRLPQMVSYEEFAPESKTVIPEPTDPHEKALGIAREEGISYSEALKKALFG